MGNLTVVVYDSSWMLMRLSTPYMVLTYLHFRTLKFPLIRIIKMHIISGSSGWILVIFDYNARMEQDEWYTTTTLQWELHSGKPLPSYGKSPSLVGKARNLLYSGPCSSVLCDSHYHRVARHWENNQQFECIPVGNKTGWWFQSLWKIPVSWDDYS